MKLRKNARIEGLVAPARRPGPARVSRARHGASVVVSSFLYTGARVRVSSLCHNGLRNDEGRALSSAAS
ncbi:hypothetical protein [Polyangium spumosum]|uniref:hypothetical protein n=1 Tax=Polyangium spumosum TaxID=889282 RepID=UPI00147926A0|nr:hypothetical protein [Polyangium spumosum]